MFHMLNALTQSRTMEEEEDVERRKIDICKLPTGRSRELRYVNSFNLACINLWYWFEIPADKFLIFMVVVLYTELLLVGEKCYVRRLRFSKLQSE